VPAARSKAEGSDRRAQILEAAKSVFAERGVKASTVRDIGTRAQIQSGSLYYHFESKIDMVDEILTAFCSEVLAQYRVIAKSDVDDIERIRQMTRYAFSLIPEHSAAVQILMNDSADLVADARFGYLIDFNNEVERQWVNAVKRAIKSGYVRREIHPQVFYRFARDAILGTVRWYRPTGRLTIDRLSNDLSDIMLRGALTEEGRG
jgi:AcrR family transcriptional regulator